MFSTKLCITKHQESLNLPPFVCSHSWHFINHILILIRRWKQFSSTKTKMSSFQHISTHFPALTTIAKDFRRQVVVELRKTTFIIRPKSFERTFSEHEHGSRSSIAIIFNLFQKQLKTLFRKSPGATLLRRLSNIPKRSSDPPTLRPSDLRPC